MQKIVELIISHGPAWIGSIAGLLLAIAQLEKVTAKNQTQPPQSRANAVQPAEVAPTPAASTDKEWRAACTKVMRLEFLTFVLALISAMGLGLTAPAVTPKFVVFELGMFFMMLMSWLSMHFGMERLRRRWALGYRS